MPQDRLLHPKASRSQKVSQLTDLEYRVWTQYLLSADDFGVMRASAVSLQADNDALDARPLKVVQRAFDRLVAVGLLGTFDQQGRRFVYQADWQTWQKVEYPRASLEPKPPAAALGTCDDVTRDLFAKHPGGSGKKAPKVLPTVAEDSPNVPQILSEGLPSNARARPGETANGLRLTASSEKKGNSAVADRAGALLEAYRAWFTELRAGARLLLTASPLDWSKACDLCALWDDPTLEKLARIFLTTDDEWISHTGREFSVFALKASWCDGRLREWEKNQKAVRA
jgi:hypothetical protein